MIKIILIPVMIIVGVCMTVCSTIESQIPPTTIVESVSIKETTTAKNEVKQEKELTTKPNKRLNSNFGTFKAYADYNCLSKSSAQWKLQEKAYTDENGLRKIGDCYLVAMGSYYGTTLGTKYKVTLINGNQFNVMLCDCKQDRHTDSNNQACLVNGSILEFYVKTSELPKNVRTSGTVSSIEFFSGGIEGIEKI